MKSLPYAKVWTAGISFVALLAVVAAGKLLAQTNDAGKIFEMPKEVGKSVTIDIPGLPAGAKKLEFVLVPGLGKVKPFLLGKYEVTQGQYETLMHTNPSLRHTGPDYPVDRICWQDAADYCARLNTILSDELRAKISFRLPTDEEWSIAVGLAKERGRTPADKSERIKNVYPYGTEWPPPTNGGNYNDGVIKSATRPSVISGSHDGFSWTAPVGSFPPNRFGLYDMGGNVSEWVEDWIDDEMNIRTLRGASHGTSRESQILSSHRMRQQVTDVGSCGFRVRIEMAPP